MRLAKLMGKKKKDRELIQQKILEMYDGKIKLNLKAEAKGIYNVTLSNGKKSYNGKNSI